jgi:hypothetical protein
MHARRPRLPWALFLSLGMLASPARASERIAWIWDGTRVPAWSQAHAAVLVQHVLLSGDEVYTRPRGGQPALAANARITPVVHVEVSTVRNPTPGPQAHAAILHAMRRAAALSTSGWVQLDMEARPSHRDAYLALVREIRRELPPSMRLSVTALAWWCGSRSWLDEIAADEVVPMLFRMGRDGVRLRTLWQEQPWRLHPRCRAGAIGSGTPEPLPADVTARYEKVYVFDAARWRDAGQR